MADLGRPYALEAFFLGQHQALEGIVAGSRDVELVFAQRYRALVRLVDATGMRLSPRAHVRLFARSDRQLFALAESDEETPDLAGWHEVWVAQPRVDFLARPVHRDLQGYGSALVRGVELVRPDGRPPRVELVLRRMPPLVVELDRKAEPWPEDHELLLVEEELLGEIRRKPDGLTSFLPLLASDRRIHFKDRRAELAGLAPGRYRFVVWPADLEIDPPEVLVEAEPGLPVPLRWRSAR